MKNSYSYEPLLHIDIPRSIIKLKTAIMIPRSAKNTQSSPSRAKVFLQMYPKIKKVVK